MKELTAANGHSFQYGQGRSRPSHVSGHPKDTRYDDGNIERYTADAWCTRLEMVASSAGWNSKAHAANAALALAPGSPADQWFQVVKDDDAIKDWDQSLVSIN